MPIKDWDFYKRQYIERQISAAESRMKLLEEKFESPIERIAFLYLTDLANECFETFEVQIIDQAKIGPYVVDFLVIHERSNTYIVVECDGHDFHEKTKEQAAHDKKRDRFLTKLGYIVLRYTGSQICNDPMEIYNDVGSIIAERKRSKR